MAQSNRVLAIAPDNNFTRSFANWLCEQNPGIPLFTFSWSNRIWSEESVPHQRRPIRLFEGPLYEELHQVLWHIWSHLRVFSPGCRSRLAIWRQQRTSALTTVFLIFTWVSSSTSIFFPSFLMLVEWEVKMVTSGSTPFAPFWRISPSCTVMNSMLFLLLSMSPSMLNDFAKQASTGNINSYIRGTYLEYASISRWFDDYVCSTRRYGYYSCQIHLHAWYVVSFGGDE